MRNSISLLMISTVVFVGGGCAAGESRPIEAPFVSNEPLINAQPFVSEFFSPIEVGIGAANIRKWQAFTSLSDSDLNGPPMLWSCGTVYLLPNTPVASWSLSGVSSTVVYRPILDIVGLRNGTSSKNETVYYHFRLNNGAE